MSSAFVHSGLSDNFYDRLVSRARRNAMRSELEGYGFIWIKTSGVPTSQRWNIDNWPTESLENILRAYHEFGGIVADLHNRQKFYPENTAHYIQIRQIVNDHKDDYLPSANDSAGDDNSSGSGYQPPSSQNNYGVNQAGYGGSIPSWMKAAGIVAVGGITFILLIK